MVIAIAFLTGSNGCKKTTEIAPTPPDPVLPTEFTVDNKWECTVDGINYKGYLVLFCEIGVSSVNQTAATLDYTLQELIMLPYFDVDKMTDEELVKIEELTKAKEGRLLTIFDIFHYNLEHTLVRFESNAIPSFW